MKVSEIGLFGVLLFCTFYMAVLTPPALSLMNGTTMALMVLMVLRQTDAIRNTRNLALVVVGTLLTLACLGCLVSLLPG